MKPEFASFERVWIIPIATAVIAGVLVFFINERYVRSWIPAPQASVSLTVPPLGTPGAEGSDKIAPVQPTKIRAPGRVSYSVGIRFFDQGGNPLVWYLKDRVGGIYLFDSPGYDPRTGVQLYPVTADIIHELESLVEFCDMTKSVVQLKKSSRETTDWSLGIFKQCDAIGT